MEYHSAAYWKEPGRIVCECGWSSLGHHRRISLKQFTEHIGEVWSMLQLSQENA